ncbi:putative NADH:ubiquinone reductase (H(+)-translocating) [Rosa chinensis]|uniref:Putative NADH:ubiquinone reductase (H(+)-translocating) n=1 Tax=Rosa chinensis TaxID=74649 RepID=A0A2P6R451_ROSCH|nr:NAD(P)H-quinone oxidoreductase subunit L, chloroplastic [Rosa chinensis]PRQ41129.1 putative NADH:ubiquinone reductase (H(+)-translocating) [Rosa chinensis]
MSCSFTSQIPQALPSLNRPRRTASPTITFSLSQSHDAKPQKTFTSIIQNDLKKFGSAIQVGAALATIELPAFAVTGMNYEEDLSWTLIQSGIVGTWYFLIMPPIIMNWLRIRWYKRNLLEMYFQFMFVFLFFPGVLLWAPFLNFRKFPRDPNMKYPWSKPDDPDLVKAGFLKYPFAEPEEYS